MPAPATHRLIFNERDYHAACGYFAVRAVVYLSAPALVARLCAMDWTVAQPTVERI